MKRNYFGEMRLQPGDDLYACWNEEFGPEDPSIAIYATSLEGDCNFGWVCTLNDDDGNESDAQDFDSEDELRKWLADQGVNVDG